MKKVCLISPTPPPIGGIALWTNNIIKYNQTEIEFIIDDYSNRKKINGPFRRVLISGFKLISVLKKLKKILKNNNIICVHIASSGSLGFIRDYFVIKNCKRKDKKVVLHLHFGRIPIIKSKQNFEWKLFEKNSKKVDKIICIDNQTEKALLDTKFANKVINIPNPITFNEQYIIQEKKEKVILFVGWVIKTKGVEELLESWNTIESKHKDWKLKIIGRKDDNYVNKLLKKYDFKNVCFEGELSHDDTLQQMKGSSILILPSYTEGFPNVIIEAMMNSMAIISTKVGAIPEMLSNECGILINEKSSIDITKAIEQIINDEVKRNELSFNAYKRVNDNYTIEKVFNKLKHIWEE